MKIDIYKSTKSDSKYLSVPEGADVGQLDYPDDIDPDMKELAAFKTGLELDPERALVGFNQEDIIRQIDEKGYAIHGAVMDASISLTGSPFG